MIRNPHQTPIVARHVEDAPDVLEPGVLYVEHWEAPGPDSQPSTAAMLCPCGCGETLIMLLLPDGKPCWDLTGAEGQPVTLHPSIDRTVRCKSHFWLKAGLIEWAGTPVPRENWV
jgi:hypothetical protein